MKVTLIIDSLGPNPAYKPPVRSSFPEGTQGDEAFADAKALYHVPHSILIPAGTVISGPGAWVHCWEDNDGIEFDNRSGKPVRVGPGIVRAVPADEPAQVMLEKHMVHVAATRKWPLQKVKDYLANLVADAKTRQAERDAAAGGQTAIEAEAVS